MVRQTDFFVEEWEQDASTLMNGDPWSGTARRSFDMSLVELLRREPSEGRTDIEVAIALAELVHDELQAYGTNSGQSLDDTEIGAAITALAAVLRRLAVPFELPFRNFTGFHTYWVRNDASGSWQARRDILDERFEPLHRRLVRLEEQTFEGLADPVSPRAEVGWPVVDEEIRELRRRFNTSTTPQDYRTVGTLCAGVLEALGRTVYDPARHLRHGETLPPADKTKQRIGRYIEDALPGPTHADLRGLTNKAIELAQHVKHAPTPTRREAGISADSVILLANMLRRLEQAS